ncbi:MAG: hypothetical protein EHM61_27400 [Acidobacteria bacterium]|nr:MAG: hypothetical protein EHM61_27400 [Acidobacteriota bacterium]
MASRKQTPDFVLSDAFAHQLLPELCFVRAAQFFPKFWKSEPEAHANMLWNRLATKMNVGAYTRRITGKKITPADGFAVFLVRFPPLKGKNCALGGAAIFHYRTLGSTFGIEAVECCTHERRHGQVVLCEWEDRPTEYACVFEMPLRDDSETAFVGSILAKFMAERSVSEAEAEDEADIEQAVDDEDDQTDEVVRQVFESWQAELPEETTIQIRERMEKPAADFADCLASIRGDHPALASLQSLDRGMRAELYRLGVVSFAKGHSDRHALLPVVKEDASSFDDLPLDATPVLEAAMEPICDLIERVFAVLTDAGLPLSSRYKERLRLVLGRIEQAAIGCLKSGMGMLA